jgi:magnesium transporter
MLTIYKTENNALKELPSGATERGAWYYMVNPVSSDLEQVSRATDVPLDLLGAALDAEERPRIEIEENHILVIVDIPIMKDENNLDTLPLGMVITRDHFISVCLKHSEIVSAFNADRASYFDTTKRTRFLFQILYGIAELYLKHLSYINRHTDKLELVLRKSMKNKALFQLFEIERSLVYFTASLKNNGMVMNKLLRLRKSPQFQHILRIFEEDEDLLEDVIIENEQARDMVEMHSNILGSMMGSFSSIISNNLNIVMKTLTIITILLAVPTMIASFWGMNVEVPWLVGKHPFGFYYVTLLAFAITGIIAYFLLKKEQM